MAEDLVQPEPPLYRPTGLELRNYSNHCWPIAIHCVTLLPKFKEIPAVARACIYRKAKSL